MSDDSPNAPSQDENQLIAERRGKLKALREAQAQGKGVAFPNDFAPNRKAQQETTKIADL